MSKLEKFDFSDIFPSEQSQFVRFDDIKDMINQPKLSIPKKIADKLDKLEFDWDMMAFPNSPQGDYQDLFDYIDRGNTPIIMTYLAGKALGIELVEVADE